MAPSVSPGVRAMSRTLLPSVNQDHHLTLGRRQPQGRGDHVGIETRMAPRLDKQDQRRDVPRAVVRLRDPHGFDVHHERGTLDTRPSSIEPLTGTAPEVGSASATSRARRPWSSGARACNTLSSSDNPSPCRRRLRARSFTARIRSRRSRWRTPLRGFSSGAVTVVSPAWARTSACRTRMN